MVSQVVRLSKGFETRDLVRHSGKRSAHRVEGMEEAIANNPSRAEILGSDNRWYIPVVFSGSEAKPSQFIVVSDVPAVTRRATVYIEQMRFFRVQRGFEPLDL